MRRLIQNGAVVAHAAVDLAIIIAMGIAAETVIAYDRIKERGNSGMVQRGRPTALTPEE